MKRYIVGFKERNKIKWSTQKPTSVNIPYITNKLAQQRDLNGATYTKTIEDLNTPTYYPAAQFCFEDVTGDKEWFLPSAGQMYLLAKNYSLINSAFSALKTASLSVISPTSLVSKNGEYTRYYWTSNLYDASNAVYLTLSLSFSYEYLTATSASGVYYETSVRCIAEY
ncbi:MAG: hypothetical protein IJV97_02405 [Alphaproteobacteria bacterium]|nr:hypothetical protein [Alphaproteobacteria bacterium]